MDQRLSDVKVWCLKHVACLSDDPCSEREDERKEGDPHAESLQRVYKRNRVRELLDMRTCRILFNTNMLNTGWEWLLEEDAKRPSP